MRSVFMAGGLLRQSAGRLFCPRRGWASLLHSHATSFGFKEVHEEEKSKLVGNVFSNVASNYDLMNDFMSVGLHRLWKDRLISKLNPFPGMKHLDVAGGTGDVAFRILESIHSVSRSATQVELPDMKETKIYVCDINSNMLTVGKKRAIEKGLGEDPYLVWIEGDAEALPFEDGSMDGYTIAFGIRNVTHIEKVLSEAYRVLKRGGRFLCLELSHVEVPLFKQLYDYYSFSIIPSMGELVAGDRESYQYLVESIRRFPNQAYVYACHPQLVDGAVPDSHIEHDFACHQKDDPVIFSGFVEGDEYSTNDQKYGFQRSDFGHGSLLGTVQPYDRHVFVCYKTHDVWPPQIDPMKFDGLVKPLLASFRTRKSDMKRRTIMTLYEGEANFESARDVLIFPDMVKYRLATENDVDHLIEEVLVNDLRWPSRAETLATSYIFVCCHRNRDQRCGVCGPALLKRFQEEINSRCLQDKVFVRACSHIGGHKYAGNVIIFGPNNNGEVTGHWYGYVSPCNVSSLLEEHIMKGKIVEHLWRGQMGLSKDDQRKAKHVRIQQDDGGLKSTENYSDVTSSQE